jgi:hypothetical protein
MLTNSTAASRLRAKLIKAGLVNAACLKLEVRLSPNSHVTQTTSKPS